MAVWGCAQRNPGVVYNYAKKISKRLTTFKLYIVQAVDDDKKEM